MSCDDQMAGAAQMRRLRDQFLRIKATGDSVKIAGYAVEAIPMLIDMLAEADAMLARWARVSPVPTGAPLTPYGEECERLRALVARLEGALRNVTHYAMSGHHPFVHDYIKDEKRCDQCRAIKAALDAQAALTPDGAGA